MPCATLEPQRSVQRVTSMGLLKGKDHWRFPESLVNCMISQNQFSPTVMGFVPGTVLGDDWEINESIIHYSSSIHLPSTFSPSIQHIFTPIYHPLIIYTPSIHPTIYHSFTIHSFIHYPSNIHLLTNPPFILLPSIHYPLTHLPSTHMFVHLFIYHSSAHPSIHCTLTNPPIYPPTQPASYQYTHPSIYPYIHPVNHHPFTIYLPFTH